MNQLFTGIVVSKPEKLLKEPERALLLLLQPNSHLLTGWQFSDEVKSSSVYGFLKLLKKIKKKVNFKSCYLQLTLVITQ